MGNYEFLTTWCLDAPIERVWERIYDVPTHDDRWQVGLARALGATLLAHN